MATWGMYPKMPSGGRTIGKMAIAPAGGKKRRNQTNTINRAANAMAADKISGRPKQMENRNQQIVPINAPAVSRHQMGTGARRYLEEGSKNSTKVTIRGGAMR